MTTIPDPREALDNPAPAPEFAQPGDTRPEKKFGERPPFPADSPVKPLGMWSSIDGSQRCYYLNWNGQLVGLEAGTRHGKNGLIALYGPMSEFLETNWPQYSAPIFEGRGKERVCVRPSLIVGFDQADASRAHIEECSRKGIFNPQGRMRGRGAHRLADGRGLVLHCGAKVMVSELNLDGTIKRYRWIDAGVFERFVYQADEPIPEPHHEASNTRPAERLLGLLQTWNWKRPTVDPRFVLGAIGASLIGGALPWRPHIWITGGKGTGKSTLNGKDGVIHRIFGEGQYRTGNASAAGLRQVLKNSTLPILFDEIEAGTNNARVQEVIELARVASSGDTMTRGSADHTAQEFTLQSPFWFSSIIIPPLLPQDRSRLAILELLPFLPGAEPPDFSKWNFAELGRRLLRRMVDGWPRLEATKVKFHRALALAGHDNRACDQFACLLACADLLIHDWDTLDHLPDDEEIADWANQCRPQRMAEITDTTPDHSACINHVATSLVQSRGGDPREMIGTWLGQALAVAGDFGDEKTIDLARERLQQHGLKLVNARYHPEIPDEAGGVRQVARWGAEQYIKGVPGFLAVAREHQALAKIFDGTRWQGGVWYQSLGRVELALPGVKVKFGKLPLRAVLVPLAAVFDADELPPASRWESLEEWLAGQIDGSEPAAD